MILNENYVILDEDDDVELLEEDILMEGFISLEEDENAIPVTLEEAVEILNEIGFYKNIKGPKEIDKEASASQIAKAKASYQKMISSGEYRAYKSSDKALLEKAMQSSEFKKAVVHGLLIDGVAGAVNTKLSLKGVAYSLFNFEGMTLLSCYKKNANDTNLRLTKNTNKYRIAHGSNFIYIVLTKKDESKVVLKRIALKAVKGKFLTKAGDRMTDTTK